MANDNTLYISSTDTTIEIKSSNLTNSYSNDEYHSFAKGSFRVMGAAGKIKLLFPAHNNLAIWEGDITDIRVDGDPIEAADFKTYQQQNFYTIGDSSNKITIPSSSTNQQFTIGPNGWLIGISIFPDGGFDGEVKIGITPGGSELSADNTYTQGQDTTNTIVEHFIDPTTIYITNINGKPITYYILKN